MANTSIGGYKVIQVQHSHKKIANFNILISDIANIATFFTNKLYKIEKYTYLCGPKYKLNFISMNLIQYVHEQLTPKRELPSFRPGDNISVSYKIIEGAKERIQVFRGDVIQISGEGATKTFTVRKISNGVGVERIIPLSSPAIASIEVLKRGKVRRARLFYLRQLTGKKAKIKERRYSHNG
jgi:large subunit ribosomal protein L19